LLCAYTKYQITETALGKKLIPDDQSRIVKIFYKNNLALIPIKVF